MSTERIAIVLVLVAAAAGCRQDMQDQPKLLPLEGSTFFADGRASRPLVEGTVARGQLGESGAYETGRNGRQYVATAPVAVTPALLARGRERYDIFCAPCHDRVGTGGGMIVLRGLKRPPSFHIPRLREAPDGYLYEAVAQGFGVMPSYAPQVPAADRWAIVAYVRALQLSQGGSLADVPPAERVRLERLPPETPR